MTIYCFFCVWSRWKASSFQPVCRYWIWLNNRFYTDNNWLLMEKLCCATSLWLQFLYLFNRLSAFGGFFKFAYVLQRLLIFREKGTWFCFVLIWITWNWTMLTTQTSLEYWQVSLLFYARFLYSLLCFPFHFVSC